MDSNDADQMEDGSRMMVYTDWKNMGEEGLGIMISLPC